MPSELIWRTSRRGLELGKRPLVMGILNITPDSFSDGGRFFASGDALRHVERMIADGADILDIGGESTRPGSVRVSVEEEIARVAPVIEAVSKRFDIPISIDTSKAEVARAAVAAGAEIINDISGLRFDAGVASVASETGSALVLMHSRGEFENMHSQQPAADIFADVKADFNRGISAAEDHGVPAANIVLDVGIGFGKTFEQNLHLLADLDRLTEEFSCFPILVGTSRKSFIGKLLDGVPVEERLPGSLATAAVAVWNGAHIIRAHDVRATADTVKVVAALRKERSPDK